MNDGGPAFPKPLDPYPNVQGSTNAFRAPTGMSLRDYFAAKALPSCMSLLATEEQLGRELVQPLPQCAAVAAYQVADAMLAARIPQDTSHD